MKKQTRSGTARVASIEATMLDICDAPSIAGSLDAAATVIVELGELPALSMQNVLALSPHFPVAATRRLGWLLEQFTAHGDLEELRAWAVAASPSPSKLDPTAPSRGPIGKGWSLIINADIEPDT